ncbi:MAG: hypothetical protein QM541_04185 [Flavobacterium sp.]|nr:hypothetical protein [Flavobacterium sp.]
MEIVELHETKNFFGGLENLYIIHISDIHLWYSTSILKRIESIMITTNHNLIILTGDYYDLPIGTYNFENFHAKFLKDIQLFLLKAITTKFMELKYLTCF